MQPSTKIIKGRHNKNLQLRSDCSRTLEYSYGQYPDKVMEHRVATGAKLYHTYLAIVLLFSPALYTLFHNSVNGNVLMGWPLSHSSTEPSFGWHVADKK